MKAREGQQSPIPTAANSLQRAFPTRSQQDLTVLPEHASILPISQMGRPVQKHVAQGYEWKPDLTQAC